MISFPKARYWKDFFNTAHVKHIDFKKRSKNNSQNSYDLVLEMVASIKKPC